MAALRKQNTRRNTKHLGGRSRRVRNSTRSARNTRRQQAGARRASRRQQRRLRSRGGGTIIDDGDDNSHFRQNGGLKFTSNDRGPQLIIEGYNKKNVKNRFFNGGACKLTGNIWSKVALLQKELKELNRIRNRDMKDFSTVLMKMDMGVSGVDFQDIINNHTQGKEQYFSWDDPAYKIHVCVKEKEAPPQPAAAPPQKADRTVDIPPPPPPPPPADGSGTVGSTEAKEPTVMLAAAEAGASAGAAGSSPLSSESSDPAPAATDTTGTIDKTYYKQGTFQTEQLSGFNLDSASPEFSGTRSDYASILLGADYSNSDSRWSDAYQAEARKHPNTHVIIRPATFTGIMPNQKCKMVIFADEVGYNQQMRLINS